MNTIPFYFWKLLRISYINTSNKNEIHYVKSRICKSYCFIPKNNLYDASHVFMNIFKQGSISRIIKDSGHMLFGWILNPPLLFNVHNLLKWKESEVAQSCPILCNPMDCSLPGSSIHWILQAGILECIAISFSRGSFWPRDQTRVSCVSCICRWVLYQLSHRGSSKNNYALFIINKRKKNSC